MELVSALAQSDVGLHIEERVKGRLPLKVKRDVPGPA